MAKTIWRGSRDRPGAIRASKTVTSRGRREWRDFPEGSPMRHERNLPIPGEWLVDTRLKTELPKLDICKIRTERIRDLTLQQMERMSFYVGPVTMKERTSLSNPRGLVHKLLFNLIGEKTTHPLSPRSAEAYRERYKEEPPDDRKIIDGYRREANRVERMIWDAQQKKRCRIANTDIAARDYVRSAGDDANPQVVDKIRNKRRAKIR